MDENPYKSPQTEGSVEPSRGRFWAFVLMVLLIVGVALLWFWLDAESRGMGFKRY